MKKKVLGLCISGGVTFLIGIALFLTIPLMSTPEVKYYDVFNFAWIANFVPAMVALFNFQTITTAQIIYLSFMGIGAILWIVHLIMVIVKKKPVGLVMVFLGLLYLALFLLGALLMFSPNYAVNYGSGFLFDKEGFFEGTGLLGPFGWFDATICGFTTGKVPLVGFILAIAAVALFFIGTILYLIGAIVHIVYIAQGDVVPESDEEKAVREQMYREAAEKAAGPDVIIVHDDEIDAAAAEREEEEEKPEPREQQSRREDIPAPNTGLSGSGITGPIIVQYINTYSPDQAPVYGKRGSVPVSEIQGEITGNKPLTAEEIRRIVKEELAPKEESKQPVIISVPAPAAPQMDAKPVTAEEVRRIISDELNAKKETGYGDVIVESPDENRPLSAEEVRRIIAEEREYKAAQKPVEEKKEGLTAEDIRAIIAEEFAKRDPKPEPKEELSASQIRAIIRSELQQKAPLAEEKIQPVTVVVGMPEAPKPAPKPVEEPEEEVEEESEPVKRAVGEINPNLPPHDKIIRIPFQDRFKEADPEMLSNYNELKSEIMSYGVKSRISNKGDTFRLHKVTFVRITVAGKSLKLYFALDPKDYANTTLPVQDASGKGVYKDIPLVFKVKSDLSLRRAKQLIADVMEKNGLEQGKVEPRNWADELINSSSSEEDDDE